MNLNLLLLSAAALFNAATVFASPDPVKLGHGCNYVILSKSGITNVSPSTINGNMGVSPIAATAMTGFGLVLDGVSRQFSTSDEVKSTSSSLGRVFAADYGGQTASDLTVAVNHIEMAFTDAASRPSDIINLEAGLIGGKILNAGVYTFTTDIKFDTDVTFHGTATDVIILQATGNVLVGSGAKVVLTGGLKPENVFWQVAEKVTVGTGGHLEGILLVKTAVMFMTGSSLNGRILAQTACTLQKVTITEPATCLSAPPSASAPGVGTAVATATATITLETVTETTVITQTTRATATDTRKTTTTTVNGFQTDQVIDTSAGSGVELEPSAKAYVTGSRGSGPFLATATATATSTSSLTGTAEATATASSRIGASTTATSTATTTATRTTTTATASADSNSSDSSKPLKDIKTSTAVQNASAIAVSRKTATATCTSTFTEA
jgi:hypothetical protein